MEVREMDQFAQSAGAVEYTECTSAEGQDPPPIECPDMTLKSDGEVLVMLVHWGIRITPSLPLWPCVVEPERAISMG